MWYTGLLIWVCHWLENRPWTFVSALPCTKLLVCAVYQRERERERKLFCGHGPILLVPSPGLEWPWRCRRPTRSVPAELVGLHFVAQPPSYSGLGWGCCRLFVQVVSSAMLQHSRVMWNNVGEPPTPHAAGEIGCREWGRCCPRFTLQPPHSLKLRTRVKVGIWVGIAYCCPVSLNTKCVPIACPLHLGWIALPLVLGKWVLMYHGVSC